MTKKTKNLILRLLDEHRVMSLATNRPDGWPQVTLVGYVNDGFLLYCFIADNSQKHANVIRDPRVSAAIGDDASHPLDLKGLSLAGRAAIVTDAKEFAYIGRLRLKRYPEYAATPRSTPGDGVMARIEGKPTAGPAVLLRIAPEILSVSDYSKGFGHSDLVTFSERDLDVHVQSQRHFWDGMA